MHHLTLNNIVTLKSRLGVTQGHWKCTIYRSHTSSYSSSIVTIVRVATSAKVPPYVQQITTLRPTTTIPSFSVSFVQTKTIPLTFS